MERAAGRAERAPTEVTIAAQGDNALTAQQAVPVTLKDGALFMEVEQNGQKANAIFTKDGNYAGARQITLEGAAPITAVEKLYGTWRLVGMNMGGISMMGSASDLGAMMSGGESNITFEEGGIAKMSAGDGTWAVSADGATLTSKDITGEHTVPILVLGDEIALDYSKAYGTQFIVLMAKS